MKKKTIKINFRYFWKDFNPEDNFFTNILRKNYNVIVSDIPDYMFYSVYPEIKTGENVYKKGEFIKKLSPKLYTFIRKIYSKLLLFFKREKQIPKLKGDFIKIFCGAEYIKPNMMECDWAFSTYFDDEINHPRHMRIPLIFINDYQLKDFGVPAVKHKIDFKKIKKEKVRFCNFIYSQENTLRNNFFKELSKYKKIDSPGRCMNNMLPIGNYTDAKKSRFAVNWVEEKLDFLKPYKFTISFENASVSGWITEKLTHPMLVNSIPIYFGHEDVSKEFNTKSFINYNDFKSMKEFINFIIKVDNDDSLYEKILNEPRYKDNKIPEDFDIKRIEKRFKEIFG